jgi:alkylation response protein AidB-like acyl-CoA dehydrogenase
LSAPSFDECVQLHGGYGYMMEYPITASFLVFSIGPIGITTRASRMRPSGRGSHEELLILDLTASARRRSAKKELAAVGELDHLTDIPVA